MRFVKNLVIGLVVAVALLAAGAYLLPRHVTVERQITIDAPPEDIFPQVNSLSTFAEWSSWTGRDPDMQVTFSGPEAGVGNAMEWTSQDPSVGNGRQEITASEDNRRVVTALDFGEMGRAEAAFDLVPDRAATQVTWSLDADMGNSPIGRYLGLMMDRWVGADYAQGLEALKARVEDGT